MVHSLRNECVSHFHVRAMSAVLSIPFITCCVRDFAVRNFFYSVGDNHDDDDGSGLSYFQYSALFFAVNLI